MELIRNTVHKVGKRPILVIDGVNFCCTHSRELFKNSPILVETHFIEGSSVDMEILVLRSAPSLKYCPHCGTPIRYTDDAGNKD